MEKQKLNNMLKIPFNFKLKIFQILRILILQRELKS